MTEIFTLALTGQSLIKYDLRSIAEPGFEAIKEIVGRADLAFTNFEGTLLGTHGGWPLKGSFFGCSDPVVLDALASIGFGALSLSNNHAFDLGPPGILSTLDEVEARGFLHAGIGLDRDEAAKIGVRRFGPTRVGLLAMDGGPGPDVMYAANADHRRPARPGVNRLKLSQIIDLDDTAFAQMSAIRDTVGYTTIDLANDSQPDDAPQLVEGAEIAIARAVFRRGTPAGRKVKVDPLDLERNLSAITQAADEGSLVIAYLHHHHWASDWHQLPDWVGGIARQCIDAGASLFVSHGAPVLQPIEIYKGRPIFYSLGNFIFHVRSEKSTWTGSEVWESVVASCRFRDDNSLEEIVLHPVVIGGEARLANPALEYRLVPHLGTGKTAFRILERIRTLSSALGTVVEIADDCGIIRGASSRLGQDARRHG